MGVSRFTPRHPFDLSPHLEIPPYDSPPLRPLSPSSSRHPRPNVSPLDDPLCTFRNRKRRSPEAVDVCQVTRFHEESSVGDRLEWSVEFWGCRLRIGRGEENETSCFSYHLYVSSSPFSQILA